MKCICSNQEIEEIRFKEAYRQRVVEAARICMDQAVHNGIRMAALDGHHRRRRLDRDNISAQSDANPSPQNLDEA